MWKGYTLFRVVNATYHLFKKKSLDTSGNLIFPNLELQNVRYFAKGKDIKKESKGKGIKKKVELNENILGEVINLEKLKSDMELKVKKLDEVFKKFVNVRTSVGSIENLSIPIDGKKHPLIELGHIVRKNPKIITVNMAILPQAIPLVLKAIAESGMNLNPQQDGTTIFIPIPKINLEHRENLSKIAKAHFLTCRDSIRNVQNKYIKSLKSKEKVSGLSQDTSLEVSEQVKFIADNYILKAQKMLEAKQTELSGSIQEM